MQVKRNTHGGSSPGGGKLKPLQALAAAVACFANAEQFIRDAKVLLQRGSNGHAFALATLANEELGKAFMWELRAYGVRVPERFFRNHAFKQGFNWAMFTVFEWFLFDVFEGLLRVAKETDSDRRDEKLRLLTSRLVRKWKRSGERQAEVLRAQMAQDAHTEEQRKAALYVDLAPDGTVKSPADFPAEAARGYCRRVERRYRRFLRIFEVTSLPTEEQFEELRRKVVDSEFLEQMGRIFEDTGKSHRG